MKFNFIRAALLWLYLPILAVQFVAAKAKQKEQWKRNGIIAAVAAITILPLVCNMQRTVTVKAQTQTRTPSVIVNDLTPAFKTGIGKAAKNRYIVIHHTASNGANRISEIAKIHLGEHQWTKIGYHYFIDNEGQAWQLLPDTESCPNAFHRNDDAIAICIAGNYSEKQVPPAIMQTLTDLCIIVRHRYGIPVENVVRHCDVPGNNTECCGKNFDIVEFRKKIE